VNRKIKAVLSVGSIVAATALVVAFTFAEARHFRGGSEADVKVWFYDQSTKRLYPAPRNLIPPDGGQEVRVRAMVIGFQGMGNQLPQLKIAYLEKYSPELKALLERAEYAHDAKRLFEEKVPSQNSAYFETNFFVKSPDEGEWHVSNSAEARRVMTEWRSWRGPGGQPPVVSAP
jgi:hypothetical protein